MSDHTSLRSWGIRGAILLVIVVLFGSGVAVGANYQYPASLANPLVTRGCVIRFDQRVDGRTVPRIHANAAHYCVGVRRVYAEYPSGDLVIEVQPVGPMVTINVIEDETLSARGIQCGPSGADLVVRVSCYSRSGAKAKAYGSTIHGTYSNLWFSTTNWSSM